MPRRKTPGPGDRVTCRHDVHAYYSDYGGNPVLAFRPGMVGTVVRVAPKVRIIDRPPAHDLRQHFLIVDYPAPETGRTERVGLNFCNAVLVENHP